MFDAGSPHTLPGIPGGCRRTSSPHEENFEGRTVGGFRIAREIARGGMGRVFLAHRVQQARVGQVAAVKLIHPHLAREQEFINMFLDEARITSSVSHPNVCRVLDFGRADGTYYLAMEYVMGESLADVVAHLHIARETEWMAEPLMKYVLHQVCEALHAVHEAQDAEGNPLGIIHRDISPYNIMLGYDGCVRVLDFGLARATEREQVTRAGVIKGRLAYMAPEQMGALAIDHRADLWSVGAVLWEGLTGRRLFKRKTELETIDAVTLEAVPPATHPRHAVPASLQRVVARALERDPSRRYATARDLGLELLRTESRYPQASMSDVSDWMRCLFELSIAQKRRSLRDAARAARVASAAGHRGLDTSGDQAVEDEATRIAERVPPKLPRAVGAPVRSAGAPVGSAVATVRSAGSHVRSAGSLVSSAGAPVGSAVATVRSAGSLVRSAGSPVRSSAGSPVRSSAGSPVPNKARPSESGTLRPVAYQSPPPSSSSLAAEWLAGGIYGALLAVATVLLLAGPRHFTIAEAAVRLGLLAKAVTADQPVSARRMLAGAPTVSRRAVAGLPGDASLTGAADESAHARPAQQVAREVTPAPINRPRKEPSVALDAGTRRVAEALDTRRPRRHVRGHAAHHAGTQLKAKHRRIQSSD